MHDCPVSNGADPRPRRSDALRLPRTRGAPTQAGPGGWEDPPGHYVADERLPRCLRSLPGVAFVNDVLLAGKVVPGDARAVPECGRRGYVGSVGGGKRSRVLNVMLCVLRA